MDAKFSLVLPKHAIRKLAFPAGARTMGQAVWPEEEVVLRVLSVSSWPRPSH